jgi:hypothetical protein
MVRLLTLQAILIPEKLSDYLIWMSKRGKQDDHYQTSENFQSEIINTLRQVSNQTPRLINNLVEGVKSLIPTLLEQPDQVEVAVWLLQLPTGLWSWSYSKVFIPDYLEHDLNLMPKFARGNKNLTFKLTSHPEWQKNLGELSIFWKNTSISKIERYQPLADLFEKLEDQPKLAAFFSHVVYGKGEVPKRIFSQIPSTDGWHSNVYGVKVERKVTFLEVLFLVLVQEFEIGEISMRVGVAVAILLVFTGLGFGGGLAVGSSFGKKTDTHKQTPPPILTDNTQDSTSRAGEPEFQKPSSQPLTYGDYQTQIPQEKKQEALDEFPGSIQVLQDMIKEIKDSSIYSEEEIVKGVKKSLTENTTLNSDSLDYSEAKKTVKANQKAKEIWIDAIYQYQKNNNLPQQVGYILSPGATIKKLKEDVETNLQNQPQ